MNQNNKKEEFDPDIHGGGVEDFSTNYKTLNSEKSTENDSKDIRDSDNNVVGKS